MSDIASRVRKLSEECLAQACWRQWRSIKGEHRLIHGERSVRSIIDPEALILASVSSRRVERRLEEAMIWWLPRGSRLISVQRFKTLAWKLPWASPEDISWYAAQAVDSGDARWARLVGEESPHSPARRPTERRQMGPATLQLLEPATLMFRMRAGFGVSAKADLLAFLLGIGAQRETRDAWVESSPVAEALGYSRLSVRRAATDMALAGLIEVSVDRPPAYLVDRPAWARLLGLTEPGLVEAVAEVDHLRGDLPGWRFWSQTFELLSRLAHWGQQVQDESAPPAIASSWARDIMEGQRTLARRNRWLLLPTESHPGAQILEPFERMVQSVAAWVDANL